MEIHRNLMSASLPFTKENICKSWYYFASTLTLTAIAFWGSYLAPFLMGKFFCGVLAALLMSRLFVIYHDFRHDAILRNSRLAKILMTAFGLIALAPGSIWDETHQHHHNHNSKFSKFVAGSFPTISTMSYKSYSPAQQRWYRIIRHPLMILFAYVPIFLVSFCLWPFFENPKKYADCGLAVLIHGILIYTVYTLGGLSAVIFSITIPCVIMYAIGGYLFYAQHNFAEVILKEDEEWDYFDAALNSSSFIKMSKLMHWFTANIGYHHVHHVNSRIPFYRLPEAMKNLIELQNPRCTSLKAKEIWRCLRLKLWDPTSQRLITFAAYKKMNAR